MGSVFDEQRRVAIQISVESAANKSEWIAPTHTAVGQAAGAAVFTAAKSGSTAGGVDLYQLVTAVTGQSCKSRATILVGKDVSLVLGVLRQA